METVWKMFTQARNFSLQVDTHRSDSFYATLALVLAAGMNNDGSYFQISVLEMVSQQHDFLYHSLMKCNLYLDTTKYECVFFWKYQLGSALLSASCHHKKHQQIWDFLLKKVHVHINFNNSFNRPGYWQTANLCPIKKNKNLSVTPYLNRKYCQKMRFLKAILIKLSLLKTSCSTSCTPSSAFLAGVWMRQWVHFMCGNIPASLLQVKAIGQSEEVTFPIIQYNNKIMIELRDSTSIKNTSDYSGLPLSPRGL